MNKKTIIFDLGGVVLVDTPYTVLDKLNLNDFEYKELSKFFDNTNLLDIGKMSLEDKLNECNYSSDILEKYKEILLNYFKIRDLNENILEIIRKLKNNNYKVFILSDNNKEASDYYTNLDLFSNIDGFVFSYEYNTIKKDGDLFDIFIDKYKLDPNDCILIDDSKENIDVAKEHGINGILFDENENIEKLYNELKEDNILL